MAVKKKIIAKSKPRTKPRAATTRSRDPQRTSASILSASVKEFTEKGFGGARINEIARRAGANKRMLYHYFGDKEALYLAVLESAYVNIRSAEAKLHLRDRDPVDAIRELTLFTWRYYIDHPEFLSILHTENLHRASHLKRSARIFDLNSPLISVISEALKRGAASGEFRQNVDAIETYVTIAALGFFYLSNRWTLSTVFGRDLTSAKSLDEWGEHIVDVVLSYLRSQPLAKKR
ncbi:MAG TPA: TetR/AcrR family transcriptional regulator [Magnetospirillaceae bacterium]|jgi:AcrR family transcriptional regulator